MSMELKKRIITSFFLIILLISMFYYSFILLIALIIIALIVWIEFYGLISKIYKKNNLNDRSKRFLAKSASLIYLSLIVLIILTNLDLKIYIFFIILISIFTDIGGIVVGKIFKGKKLTKISPNKTVSGAVGSLLFSIILIPFFISYLDIFTFNSLVFYTLLVSIISQFGDLFISLIKRKAKVKHTSDLLPGHGGFLDRIDGVLLATPSGIILLGFF